MGFFNRLFGIKSKKEKQLLSKIANLDDNDNYQEIVDLVDSLPQNELSADILSEKARAYNNLSWQLDDSIDDPKEYLRKAVDVFKSIENKQGKNDIWNYRIGYSYFFLDDLDNAKKHLLKGDQDRGADLIEVINYAEENNIPLEAAKLNFFNERFLYEEDEITNLENYIESNFGKISNVMHEVISPDIHCDIYIVEPTEKRNYYTLITGGMGAFDMLVPEQFDSPKNVELVMNLPPDWNVNSDNEEDYWPLRWLKVLARLPIEQQTFLGWGHTIPTGEVVANTEFEGLLLISAEDSDSDEGAKVNVSKDKDVIFYYVIPIYERELQFKLENGAGELLDKFSEAEIPYPPVLDVNRLDVCLAYEPVENDALLDNVIWKFKNHLFSGLMPFYEEIKEYNNTLDNPLDDFSPFAMMFRNDKIKLMYDVAVESKEDLFEHEELTDEKYLDEVSEDGLYHVKIVATLTGSSFGALETLFLINNSLSNKHLGDKNMFGGLELIGEEEDGTPLMYLMLS